MKTDDKPRVIAIHPYGQKPMTDAEYRALVEGPLLIAFRHNESQPREVIIESELVACNQV